MKKNKFSLILLTLFAAFALVGCSANSDATTDQDNQDTEVTEFKLGFIPTEKAEDLTPKAGKLAEFLESKMGVEVSIVVPTDYEALIEGIRFNNLDAAFMDSAPAWLAVQKADAEVILAELEDGEPYYYAELFALKDSNINTLQDVVGKRIAFTSMTGSSGFIFPIGEMINKGFIRPATPDFAGLEKALQESFSSYTVSGGYAQSLQLLLEGKVDVVGGAHDAPLEYLSPEDLAKVKTVVRLGKSPSHPVVASAKLDQNLKAKFIQAMLELNKPENIAILTELYGVDGIIEAETKSHLGDLGKRVEAVTGIQQKVLEKKS